ncbi:MarR family winged helix-turn-helix transcriptional regulator [Streptomyces sp. NPDC007088]|uniref:MarR family winged helix-turn-helix transcriptional regulator n=1 Tax=Streptomyces sp. NPDC007088 TaxID=3364773 RepID=UPI0036C656B6
MSDEARADRPAGARPLCSVEGPRDAPADVLAGALRPRLARVSQALRREWSALPVTQTQSAVLEKLCARPRTISELARAEGVRLPSMTQTVNRMTRIGWVSRPGGAARGHRVILTEAGRAVFAEVTAAREHALAARLADLTPEQRATLAAALPVLDRLYETRHAGRPAVAEPGL